MGNSGFLQPDLSLAEAFAGMPLETPERSAWPLLAGRMAERKHWPRWPLALAASLLALMLIPARAPISIPNAELTVGAAEQRLELTSLMSESARLERLLAVASDDGASSATAAALGLELEDRLHFLDAELEANRDPGRQLALWQQRVQLLRSFAAVEASRHYLAAEGRGFDVALVSAY